MSVEIYAFKQKTITDEGIPYLARSLYENFNSPSLFRNNSFRNIYKTTAIGIKKEKIYPKRAPFMPIPSKTNENPKTIFVAADDIFVKDMVLNDNRACKKPILIVPQYANNTEIAISTTYCHWLMLRKFDI